MKNSQNLTYNDSKDQNKLFKQSSLIEWVIAIILALILFALLGNILDPNVPGCATNISYG